MRPRQTFVMWKHCFGRARCPLAKYIAKRCNFMSAEAGPAFLGAPVSKILGDRVAVPPELLAFREFSDTSVSTAAAMRVEL